MSSGGDVPERILFVAPGARPGGGNRFLLSTGAELRRRGVVVDLLFLRDGPAVAAARREGFAVDVADLPPPDLAAPLRSARATARAVRLLRRRRPVIVHANDLLAARSVAIASRWVGASLVCHNHRPQPLTDRELAWAFRGLPAPRAVIDVCETNAAANRDLLRRRWPRVAHAVVRNGIDLGALAPASRPAGGNAHRLGCVANLLPIKRIEDLLDMMALLARRRADIELWLIGDDSLDRDYSARLRARASYLGDRVRFLGRRDDVTALLGELDLVVHAAEAEACPFALLEALACGMPVVAADSGGVAEIVQHEESGWLVPPRRPDLLAERVDALLDDRQAMRRCAAAGRRRVEQLFDVRDSGAALLAIYGAARRPS